MSDSPLIIMAKYSLSHPNLSSQSLLRHPLRTINLGPSYHATYIHMWRKLSHPNLSQDESPPFGASTHLLHFRGINRQIYQSVFIYHPHPCSGPLIDSRQIDI